MLHVVINWFLSAVAILITANLVSGFRVDSFTTSLIVALVLGVVNAVIKPILSILTLPISLITLGLFSFVINALLILLVDMLVPGFSVDGFVPALIAAVILWVINMVINFVLFPVKAL